MSTHEQAKKKSNELTFPYNMFFDDYITQQEKKDKLLEFYKERLEIAKEYIREGVYFDRNHKIILDDKIKALEKELNL